MRLAEDIQNALYQKAKHRLDNGTVVMDDWAGFVAALTEGKFVLAHWDGTAETERAIKEETGATIRCIPFDQSPEDGICIKSGAPSNSRVLFAKAY